MPFSWITRAHHADVCAQLEQRISELKADKAALEERLKADAEERRRSTESFLAALAPRPDPARPAFRSRPRPEEAMTEADATFDPNDNGSLLRQAMHETGSRKAQVVMQRMTQIRDRARHAGTSITGPLPVSAEVQALIDKAEADGRAAAHNGTPE